MKGKADGSADKITGLTIRKVVRSRWILTDVTGRDYRSPSPRPLVIFIMSRERPPDKSRRILDKTAWRQNSGSGKVVPRKGRDRSLPRTPKTDTSS